LEDDGFYYLNLVSGDTFGSGSELGLPSLDEGIFDPNTLAPAPAQGPSGGSSGGSSSAANNGTPQKTPWYKNDCIKDALGDLALHGGIDAVGLIPEAGGIARVIGHQAGYVGVVADHVGFKVVDAFGKSTSTVSGLAGLTDTSPTGLLSTGLTIAGFIPGLGQVSAAGSLIVDIYKTGKAIGQCH
jgi:hypothetical protein